MSGTKLSKVLVTSTHAVTLDGGAQVAPGEAVEDLDVMGSPHNRGLVIDGQLAVLDGPAPKVRHDDELVADAAKESD